MGITKINKTILIEATLVKETKNAFVMSIPKEIQNFMRDHNIKRFIGSIVTGEH